MSVPRLSPSTSARVHAQQISKVPRTKRTFKVIMIGDPGVGKTCLSFRFCNGRFPDHTEATIGVDFRERMISLDGEMLRVQLWDTAGQERFRQSMVSHYYRNVHAVVFVYDLTNPHSFSNLSHWIAECHAHNVSPSQTPMILVGNKLDRIADCKDTIAVPTNDAQRFADTNDMPLFETSAKADSNSDHVESIFMTLVHKLKESKAMHVQSEQERANAEAVKLKQGEEKIEEGAPLGTCAALQMGLHQDFLDAVVKYKELRLPFLRHRKKKHHFELLWRFDELTFDIWGLYMQAVVGDVNVPKKDYMDPEEKSFMWAWILGNRKWHAWNRVKGMAKDEAKELYINKVTALEEDIPGILDHWKDEMEPRVPDLKAWIPDEERDERLRRIEHAKRERREREHNAWREELERQVMHDERRAQGVDSDTDSEVDSDAEVIDDTL